jgi:hypothetical protein
MGVSSDAPTAHSTRPIAEFLNRECFCITLDRCVLREALEREVGDTDFFTTLSRTHPHLFSTAPLFLSQADLDQMLRVVRAIEAAARLPAYRDAVLSFAPAIAHHDHGPRGAFMGYDFHLAATGPKLIEVNTNAGGAFLTALLVRAQRACCDEVDVALRKSAIDDFDTSVLRMFLHEWTLQGRAGTPGRVAIVDDEPQEQYLYPEFLLAQRFFLKQGIEAVIADARQLIHQDGRLIVGGLPIDLVYNRLVDFPLDHPGHDALRAAYLDGSAVVTPNPHVHALYADKRNLILLSDQSVLRSWGLSEEVVAGLAGIPRTVPVTAENARDLWAARKTLFFKPSGGHGSKAVYRGDKVTKGVWQDVIRGGYVAQEFAPPGERMIRLDGTSEARKADVRLYIYDGQLLLAAARLYQGQTTNFRTPGGGFAPVFAL